MNFMLKRIRYSCFAALFLFFTEFSSAQNLPNLYLQANDAQMQQWVDSVFDKMTLDERIGQLFMIVADPNGNTANTQAIIKNITDQKIGGILYSKGTVADQARNTNLYQQKSKVPLLISFDGEWGLSMRLEETPKFPRNMLLGAIADNDLIYMYGEEVGRECKRMGVHINFAPVLDVNINPNNPVIGTRSFGENPQLVAAKGIAYAKGLESAGVIAVGKHFPGHGDTEDDSHSTLPVIPHALKRLEEVELYPFSQFIKAGFSGIMTGHLSIPALDSISNLPTSLSPVIVNDLLKKRMNFQGLCFTDALVMNAARKGTGSICVQALLAGSDILLSPAFPAREFEAVKKAISDGTLDIEDIEAKCLKILAYKYISGLNNYQPINLKNLSSRINTSYSEWLIKKLYINGMVLLKNEKEVVPVTGLRNKKMALLSIGERKKTNFQEVVQQYSSADIFNLSESSTEQDINKVFKRLESYDVIMCGFHSNKADSYNQIKELAKNKEVILSFFMSPYYVKKYEKLIAASQATVLAFDNSTYAQESASQAIMGGQAFTGRLPVMVGDSFPQGTGIRTNKIRLGYQLPEDAGIASGRLAAIDQIAKEGVEQKAYPGCQILVAKNGTIIYNKAFGYFDYANTHPVQTSDVYDLASVTKASATLFAVMKLVDSKKITINDKLSQYIPELKNSNKEDITIKEALFHESGLVSFLPFYQQAIDPASYEGKLYSSKRDLVFRTEFDINTYTRTDFKYNDSLVSSQKRPGFNLQVAKGFYLKDNFSKIVLDEIIKSPLKQKDMYLYSDLNFMLLKEVVERISRQTLDAFLEKEFYADLGAYTTMFKPRQRIDSLSIAPTENDQFLRNQILIGYPDDEAAAFLGGVSGNAGLFSNANDLAKVLQLLLDGGEYGGKHYLSKETIKLFTTAKSVHSRRGLGFDKPDTNDNKKSPTGKLAPASTIGHTGFTGTCFWVDPDSQLIYIFLSNRVYPSRTNRELMKLNIRSRIQDAIYEAVGLSEKLPAQNVQLKIEN